MQIYLVKVSFNCLILRIMSILPPPPLFLSRKQKQHNLFWLSGKMHCEVDKNLRFSYDQDLHSISRKRPFCQKITLGYHKNLLKYLSWNLKQCEWFRNLIVRGSAVLVVFYTDCTMYNGYIFPKFLKSFICKQLC